MQPLYDYKQFAVLYVDDEEKSLKYFARAFEDQFRIFTAANAQDGLKLLEEHQNEIGLLMTDQRMPGEKGVWLLERARQLRPRIIRILVTAYADMDAAVAAVNSGAIYKYISKPWDPPQLETTLKRGLEFFIVQRERDHLLREKMAVLHNMMIADRIVSLGLLAAGLSHHIRNALVAVKTFLDLTPAKLEEENIDLNGLRNPEFWKEYYLNVQAQIQRINGMLKDLDSASETPPSLFTEQVRLHEVIADARSRVQGILAERQVALEVDLADSLPALCVDKPKFYRLFELLLRDEAVSLPPGATVSLTARPGDSPAEVVVEVKDNGPGLPKEALRLIFDPFVARSSSPMEYGINLMTCYFIVHHHGGRIEARSEAGQGTRFTLRLVTNPNSQSLASPDDVFLEKVLLNDALWERLMTASE